MFQNKFRPQESHKIFIMKQRRKYGRTDSYNFQSRVEWYPIGYAINKKTISRQFSKLHNLACHSPKPIAKKWGQVYNQRCKKLFGDANNQSMRFANTWTANSWL